MARTLKEIYEDIIADKESDSDFDTLLPNPENWESLYNYSNFKLLANTVLKGLSNSLVAIWRLIAYVIAYAVYYQEVLYDIFKSEVTTITERTRIGQLPWIIDKVLAFQYGDSLTWDGSQYTYETIDTTKQIVTQTAASVASGVVTIKAAKGDIGTLEALSTDEKTALQYYLIGQSTQYAEDGVLPAGMEVNLISETADLLKLAYTVVYDPQVLNENGELLSDTSVKPVNVAITNYIQQLPFNSKLRISKLTDAVQAADGVVDVVCDEAWAKYASVSYIDILATTQQAYTAYAGYIDMDPDRGLDGYYDFPANTIKTITYVADED